MLVWAFGWSGGKQLVGDSYEGQGRRPPSRRPRATRGKAAKRKARAAETS
jgi:hypothetical protein